MRGVRLVLKLGNWRLLFSAVLTCLLLFLCVHQLQCRLVEPPWMVDIRKLTEQAPVVFRGKVVEVSYTGEDAPDSFERQGIATFEIDRVYRGDFGGGASLHFVYEGVFTNGHNCIAFQTGGYWLVFAREKDGHLELVDDCIGALTVSSLLGPNLAGSGWIPQMEADFLAGLADEDPAARVISIQRLGSLGLKSSRDALHRVLKTGDTEESRWAIYAALRTGDISVLPKVEHLLRAGDRGAPERAMAVRLQDIDDPAAVPDLLAILSSASGDLTRKCVLTALGEKLRDPKAVPSLATHLSDPDPNARYDALDGLRVITHEKACTLPPNWQEQDVEPQIANCKAWWEQTGRYRSWPRD
jgi:HEAT repeats